ncbi:polysaccharide biosynthesis/export family protein [Christiangramia crocea]|uniref:Polysaccharide biosynthesis/export family protein n=1 Tax=Christiangramia crocea TaxID=2904124 RepID=A0A9X2A456_9FLAO|nr:polysaccharide biosynthesis/export family protein [Gramella crocea]MCG9970409.1 polysaccharide biosynthesis/export family protein [Gramella crocea]
MRKIIMLLLSTFMIIGCATKDQIVYFNDAESLEGMENILDYEPVIQVNDILHITVSSSSLNKEIVEPFQMPGQNLQGGGGGGQNQSMTGYIVNPEGNIKFPVLGKTKVSDLTRSQVEDKIEKAIKAYVKDPIVNVRIMNFSVTVLGEAGATRVKIDDGRITMPELIAEVGDISYDGKRENILIIREENGIKKIGRIDMTETDLFNSPFYYLKQNDIVYVEPTYRTVKSAGFFTSYQGIISVGTTIISLYLLINGL